MNGASDLKARQETFLRAILDEGAPLPEGWTNRQAAGMAVYRGNYRSALVGALENTFERTALYVGESAFKQASAHHAITHPPAGWTIDEVGAGFDATCEQLFANNPEVADLAWLEWSMLQVAIGPDVEPLGPQEFAAATGEFGDNEWMALRLEFQARSCGRIVETNLTGLWNALEDAAATERPDPRLAEPRGCLVWREGERPTFQLTEPEAVTAFTAMQEGATYGEVIVALAGNEPSPEQVQDAAMRAGALLGDWLKEGMIISLKA
ncbi:HvfC/BufC N-terminal domain-containing protein [Erythrobacter rubeus]|uniref:DNA-binding domain-containing protein n=1 Tax=Erythrobacter rubeus TaxID=2760803 RepID=A0ABR8KKE9_9SPHN|nr:DNA-binding domain-containing protein [Erythrobacter rubeus]MBD2840743.1 putative DNA-binding domain-containing protein [Erythrobacter rubeus]